MKISKSILNPSLSWSRSWSRSRSRDQPMSLTTCLSRKLHANGSTKGGGGQASAASAASPMFTTTTIGKKRENAAEPSSPKVTCIGQVRVKTKIKKRRNNAGEVSFRKADYRQPQQECIGQRWVHFPHTICEALRADLSCLIPCRPSEKEEEEEERNGSKGRNSSCARWLVTLHDGGGGQGREVELVVGGGDDEERRKLMEMRRTSSRSRRRHHVLEDFEIKDDMSEARVSICIPPKNALLLMRCRSDPVKAAALTNRFCKEAPMDNHQEDEYVHDDDNEDNFFNQQQREEAEEKLEAMAEDGNLEENEAKYSSSLLLNSDKDDAQAEKIAAAPSLEYHSEDLENTHQKEELQNQKTEVAELKNDKEIENEEKEDVGKSTSLIPSPSVLPDCLLLMMFEPKLSMEVSKETWVCSTDFVRWLPQRQRPKQVKSSSSAAMKENHSDESKRMGTDSDSDDNKSRLLLPPQPSMLPPRSSCSLPSAAVSMAAMIEHKLVNGVGYEPLVLTRCKSEPMRTAAAKLAPDSCFWTKRKLEPLCRAASHAGAAAVGV